MKNSKSEIYNIVQESIQHHLEEKVDINVSTSLGELNMDSLKVVEIVFELEVFLGIEVEEEKLEALETIGDVIEMIISAQKII